MIASLLTTFVIPFVALCGTVAITRGVGSAIIALLRERAPEAPRMQLVDGVLTALELELAATLFKTLVLWSWTQLGMLVVVLALRTTVKRLFIWEQRHAPLSLSYHSRATVDPSTA